MDVLLDTSDGRLNESGQFNAIDKDADQDIQFTLGKH